MKITRDGSLVYVDLSEREELDESDMFAKATAAGSEFAEVFRRVELGQSVRTEWLATYDLRTQKRIKP